MQRSGTWTKLLPSSLATPASALFPCRSLDRKTHFPWMTTIMELLSEDDLNLKDMTWEELNRAWDLWFDIAQATNDYDPPWTHGVFQTCEYPIPEVGPEAETSAPDIKKVSE